MSCDINVCLKYAMDSCHAVQHGRLFVVTRASVWDLLHVDMSAPSLQCLLNAAVLVEPNGFQI